MESSSAEARSRRAARDTLEPPPSGALTVNVPFGPAARSNDHANVLQAVESVSDLVAFVDSDGFLEFVNSAARRVLGIRLTESCSGLRLADFHTSVGAKQLDTEGFPIARRSSAWRGASVLLTRAGREIPVTQTIVARRAYDGRPCGFATLMRDISTVIPGQAARKANDRWFCLLFATVTDGYALVNNRGVIVDANARFARMLGYARRDVIGRVFRDCVAIETPAAVSGSAPRGALIDYHGKAMLRHADGKLVPVIAAVRKVSDHEDALIAGHCAIVTGIPRVDLGSSSTDKAPFDSICNSCCVLDAQEAERKRVATELHDGLGQSLSIIKFQLEQALAKFGPNADGEAVGLLRTLMPKVKGSLEEVRRIAMNLRPSTLEDLGVMATLSWFLREYSSVYHSIAVDNAVDVREDEIPDAIKLPLFRIVQEAFNNVAKHSRATRVSIRLHKQTGVLRLRIEDNGVGFDPDNIAARNGSSRTLGHAGMLNRVQLTNGNLVIETAPSAGVQIEVTWPCQDASCGLNHSPR